MHRLRHPTRVFLIPFLMGILIAACGDESILAKKAKKKPVAVTQSPLRVEYASEWQSSIDSDGYLILENHKLPRWSGRTPVGNSTHEVVSLD